VFGTVFFAGIHDFGAIWASVRNKGRSVGALTAEVVGPRARALFMIVIFLLLLMVNAVFAVAIARLFTFFPSSVLPAWSAIAVAVVIGWLIYRRGVGLLWPSIVGMVLLCVMIALGDSLPITLPETTFGLGANAQWIVLLFVYAGIASMLPVWLLLQPCDYINGLQLFIGLGVLYGAVVMPQPAFVAPAFNTDVPASTPPLVPLLFVTIACGAISGFHGLVASGTTVATFLALGACLGLAFGAGGVDGSGGLAIWPLFGTTNQLLAGLTLMVVTVMLVKFARPVWYTILPMCWLLAMTVLALVYQLWGFAMAGNYFLVALGLVILAASIMVILEAVAAFDREQRRLVRPAVAH